MKAVKARSCKRRPPVRQAVFCARKAAPNQYAQLARQPCTGLTASCRLPASTLQQCRGCASIKGCLAFAMKNERPLPLFCRAPRLAGHAALLVARPGEARGERPLPLLCRAPRLAGRGHAALLAARLLRLHTTSKSRRAPYSMRRDCGGFPQ